MADVARAAGVSKNTVSLALRNDPQIPLATRERVEKAANRLGYQRNQAVGELMARLRRSGQPGHQATLALVNANRNPDAFTRHPTIPSYVEGCRRRARSLGYTLDQFFMHDPAMTGEALSRIFAARSIRGVVLVGLMDENQLPPSILPVMKRLPCVVTGVRTRDPALSFACVDHHMLALQAVEHALTLGYRRPALVLDGVIDELVNGRFTAGYMIGQRRIPRANRIPPFYRVKEARQNPDVFCQWMKKAKPDVIFTLYTVVRQWLEENGWRVPRDVGLIQLEWRPAQPGWAGMHQHNDVVGEAAIEMLDGLLHRGESGEPAFPRATLIGPTWVDGATVRKR
jgi:DNA-binding LacI/PurR family transcriptional regulator